MADKLTHSGINHDKASKIFRSVYSMATCTETGAAKVREPVLYRLMNEGGYSRLQLTSFAVFVPKIFYSWWKFDKVLKKIILHSFFDTVYILTLFKGWVYMVTFTVIGSIFSYTLCSYSRLCTCEGSAQLID